MGPQVILSRGGTIHQPPSDLYGDCGARVRINFAIDFFGQSRRVRAGHFREGVNLVRNTVLLFGLLLLQQVFLMTACIVVLDKPPPRCGDGFLAGNEACDDDNSDDGDGCSSACEVESGWSCQGAPSTCSTTCGDGIMTGAESCDEEDFGGASCLSEGYSAGSLLCTSTCSLDATGCAVCGNGICEMENAEDCDNCQDDCGFVQLSVGSRVACACRADGTVWCWGENNHGQLGHGLPDSLSRTPVQVVGIPATASHVDVAGEHACVLLDDGTVDGNGVWCWGRNNYGQLGISAPSDHHSPVQVSDLGEKAQQIDIGWFHSCALLQTGDVKCWGINYHWALGNCSVSSDDHSAVPMPVEGISDIIRISADGTMTCALQNDSNTLWCWGNNSEGQLGIGTLDATCIPTQPTNLPPVGTFIVGDQYAFALEDNGQAWSWGGNDWGQLGDQTDTDRSMPVLSSSVPALRSVGLGWDHTCGVTLDSAAICWGCNDIGQLGIGVVTSDFQTPGQVIGLSEGVREAVAGYDHSCALLDNGKILCWGANEYGQLGTESEESSLEPVLVAFP